MMYSFSRQGAESAKKAFSVILFLASFAPWREQIKIRALRYTRINSWRIVQHKHLNTVNNKPCGLCASASDKKNPNQDKSNSMKITSIILLLILSFSIAHAEEGVTPKLQKYDVEVIIFEDAHARYINSEDWNTDSESGIAASDTIGTPQIPNKVNDKSFENIKPTILTQEHRRINNSSEYNVLFYGSWRQPGLDDKKAFEINIEELKNNHSKKSENSITGNFKLILARYLHIYGDLEYQRNPADTSEGTVSDEEHLVENKKAYPVKIHRRMRSKELHYIDHPLVGMLIQINPVEASEEKAASEETAEKSANP